MNYERPKEILKFFTIFNFERKLGRLRNFFSSTEKYKV